MQQKPKIESKNLTILEDQMNKELLAYQKCTTYANQFQDSTLKTTATAIAGHHQNNFNALRNYLDSHQ